MSEVLFALTMDKGYNTTDVASKLEGVRAQPELVGYYDTAFLSDHIQRLHEQGSGDFAFNWYPYNAPGQWMSQNIASPNTVMDQPATVESVAEQLDDKNPDLLVVASYLGGYATFKAISEYTREHAPKTKIVSAAVGALLDETTQYADYRVTGDQVTDLRHILGDKTDSALKIATVKGETTTWFNGKSKSDNYGLIMSSLGCPYGCDFCPSTAQFGKKFTSPFSAEEVINAITAAKEEIAPDDDALTLSLGDPQGMGDVKLWKTVLEAGKDLPFICDLVTTTSSKIIQKLGIDELTQGNLRVTTVNIGVESLLQGYTKNKNVDLKQLIAELQDSGISVVSTFIVGLDWHTKDNIRHEVELLRELDSDGYIVANLEMQPGTPLYNAYKKAGRLEDVPPYLLNFYGYQAFKHPHFQSGFNDMLPLMADIEEQLTDGDQVFAANMRTYLQRTNQVEAAKRAEIQSDLANFERSLDPQLTKAETIAATGKYAAELYFQKVFRQMDLFHPFILSTN